MPAHAHGIATNPNQGSYYRNSVFCEGGGNKKYGYLTNAITENSGGGDAHSHSISTTSTTSGAASGSTANSTAFNTGSWGASSPSGHTHTMSSTGSSSSMPPYLVVYAWKRTK